MPLKGEKESLRPATLETLQFLDRSLGPSVPSALVPVSPQRVLTVSLSWRMQLSASSSGWPATPVPHFLLSPAPTLCCGTH